jgi:type I restriction enzyme M protein
MSTRSRLCVRRTADAATARNADSFRADLHPALKADFVPVRKDLANPPFNMSVGGGENLRPDVRWKFGMPPVNNANYAWIQHSIHHLSPVGVAGFVMANTTSSRHSCAMKITQDVRKYAAEQGIVEEEVLKKGMGG